jgi:hypothetical protein
MPPHDGANGSVPALGCELGSEPRARRALAACAALALATGCATATAPPAQRAPDPAVARAQEALEAAREASGFVGVWAARVAADAQPARAVTLELRKDGTAELVSVRLGREVETQPGRWGVSGEALRVEWDPRDGSGAVPAPTTWLRADGRLVPAPSDPVAGGEAGPVLARWDGSRTPRPGCRWHPFVDATLALRLLVEACDGDRRRFVARGAEIVELDDGADPAARGTPIVQVFAKPPRQPLADAIRKRFFPPLVPRVRAGCVVRRGGGVDLGDPAKQTWTIAPTDKYRAQTARWRAAEPSAMVCGPYGLRDGVGYFEFHPAASADRYLFVWLGREEPRFDERSIELLD